MTVNSGLTEAQKAELKLKYDGRELLLLSSKSAAVVAVVPNFAQAMQYEAMQDDSEKGHTAKEWLIRECIVHPAKAELDALLVHHPVLVERWVRPLLRAAGDADKIVDSPCDVPELQAKYAGRDLVRLVSVSPDGATTASMVARVPNLVEMREYRRRVSNPKTYTEATPWLVRSCVVEPAAADEWAALLDRRPMLLGPLEKALLSLAGGAEEVEVGKL